MYATGNVRLELGPSSRVRIWIQSVLFVGGVGLVAYFVVSTGPRQVLEALRAAGPFLPLLALLELVTVLTDARAFASLAGPDARRIELGGWLRSSALSYVCLTLLPAGRTASEVARASVLARYLGPLRAATAGAQLQAAALIADGVISALAGLVVLTAVENAHHLPALLAGNVVVALGGGLGLLVLIRHPRVAAALARRFPRLFAKLVTGEGRPHTSGFGGSVWSFVGRLAQLFEHALAVRAVGGKLDVPTAAVAYGIHVVSATIGVAIPNQVGVADGAYVLFADTLGFAGAPARALAAMLAIRATQVALALVCLIAPLVWLRGKPEEPPASVPK